MLPGISGSLLSSSYLDESVAHALAGRDGEASARKGLRAIARCLRHAQRRVGPASSLRAVLDTAILPVLEVLGYTVARLDPAPGERFAGVLHRGAQPAAVTVALPWGAALDGGRRAALLEGAKHNLPWALVCNGGSLVLLDASRSWSRRWLAIDLAAALQDEHSSRLLWALVRAEALIEAPGRASLLEDVVRASDAHATAVCSALGSGVLEALQQLVTALGADAPRAAKTPPAAVLEQAVTVVYRVLFLLFAEARALVPTWHRVYREAYTVEALRRRLAARGDVRGVWAALQAIARLAHAGCAAGDLRVTAFNGRLFAPERAPLAERVRVPDAIAGRVLLSLATRRDGAARRPIAYGDLGVEQLGSVYERVLELRAVSGAARIVLEHTAAARKATGTFYTPRSLTDFIVRRTLAPLVRDRSCDDILALRIVDPAMGSGAFLVSACRYLAHACEQALSADGAAVVSEETRATLRRRVAERCLYGVDINPMAVQVARLSLWLTTLAADCPLTFLDHHLAVGDSLLGARFRDLARQPPFAGRGARRPAAQTPPLFVEADVSAELAAAVLPERFRLSREAADTVAAVRDKERRLAALDATGATLDRWKRAADLWCAAWCWSGPPLSPALFGDLTARLLRRTSSLSAAAAEPWLSRARDVARRLQFFHWELAFPEVFFDARGDTRPDGGFDAVLGNPPWDVLRADNDRERTDRRESRDAMRHVTAFVRDAGIYGSGGRGHANSYQLFVERALQQLRPGGRFGLVLPGGLLTDLRSGYLRRTLLDTTTLDTVAGFDNRDGIFPIHRSTRFALVMGTRAAATTRLRCRFGLSDPAVLDDLPDRAEHDPPAWSALRIDRQLLERLDGEHLTIPDVAQPLDLGILADVSRRIPPLGSTDGWHARFGRELNATDDARHFVPASDGGRAHGGIPVLEGKCLEPFRARVDRARHLLPAHLAAAAGSGATAVGRTRLAYRDVASATNKLTLIAALLPPGCVSTHTIFCLKTAMDDEAQRCLLGLLNSLIANYLVRRWVGAHVTTSVMSRLQVPRPERTSAAWREIGVLVARLEHGGIDEDVTAYAHLNAVAARLYGLDHDRYAYIVSTFRLLDAGVRAACVAAHAAEAGTPRGR